nr:Sir2 family NAD-dependent protein deacetylase [Companilactobacillus sp.]
MFDVGPTTAHKTLAALEQANKLEGVITTNVDYLHEIAGSKNVADVWSSFNVNYCLTCHKTYPIEVWNQGHAPMCPDDGGIISPSPTFNHIGRSAKDLAHADNMMKTADLVIVIGSNGYYSNLSSTTKVVQINPKRTGFDLRANLNFHKNADEILLQVAQQINLEIK